MNWFRNKDGKKIEIQKQKKWYPVFVQTITRGYTYDFSKTEEVTGFRRANTSMEYVILKGKRHYEVSYDCPHGLFRETSKEVLFVCEDELKFPQS